MAHFNKDTLETLASLARICCSNEAKKKLTKHLQSILNYIEQLSEVDTEGVPSCNHVLEEVVSELREDETDETLDRETFLANSPSHVGGMIRVPPVIKF